MSVSQIEVLEQGMIESPIDLLKLDVVDWNRLNGYWRNPGEALERVGSWFVNTTRYAKLHINLYSYPERDDFPGWKHRGDHEKMGQLFWNYFHYRFKGTLAYSDCPDFEGTLTYSNGDEIRCWGDIGKVSPIGLVEAQRQMSAFDLWISVVDAGTQVVLEPFVSLRGLFVLNQGDFPQVDKERLLHQRWMDGSKFARTVTERTRKSEE